MSVDLHQRALSCVKNYKRSEAELLQVLTEIDKTKAYLSLGSSSLFSYCVKHLSLSESETFRFTQVSRKLDEAPKLKAAILEGRLTVAKASRIAAVITPATEESWISKAATLTHRDLEREVASEKTQPSGRERIKVLTPTTSELKITISKGLEVKLLRAQEVLRTRNLAETLEQMVDRTLMTKDPLEMARRIKKQARTCKLRKTKSNKPEATRHIPRGIKHEIYLRDQGKCAFKGCGEKKWVQIHHIQPYGMGGRHELENLMLICSAHHSLMHSLQKNQPRIF